MRAVLRSLKELRKQPEYPHWLIFTTGALTAFAYGLWVLSFLWREDLYQILT